MVDETRAAGRTVFLSSHILPEVEHTCTRVGIIREGELVRVSEVNTLKDLKQSNILIHFAQEPAPDWFNGLPGIVNVQHAQNGTALLITVQGDQQAVIQTAAQHHALSLTTHEPSLEEIFLRFYQTETLSDAVAR
ncbi:ATP-binding protein DrrA1-3 family domain-containing protein [Dictyobacter kobayashii]|uniref:Daunorubicin resistance ATP-binding protein DrrA1/2-like C-terminal domain-containing protein n=1 Tax=Dictyobacter kobayashii TaxID=2014872 RepID=A0A402AKA2_9CHLR|nr:DUF4162 domain-containing protein [Dictyobacter kobayashii]GCE19513.1 hypothetical protein KDK_33130 [Dictyobacter kobayashii]